MLPVAGPSKLPDLTGQSLDPEDGESRAEQAEPMETTIQEDDEEERDHPPPAPPRILITTSPSPYKDTYQFCDDLCNVFPGGEFFKRPKGRGFELGRVARWAAKRGFGAVIIVNQDHKTPSRLSAWENISPLTNADAITLMQLPAGPTAYLKLTSVQLGTQIYASRYP